MKNILTEFSLSLKHETENSKITLHVINEELAFSIPDPGDPGRLEGNK